MLNHKGNRIVCKGRNKAINSFERHIKWFKNKDETSQIRKKKRLTIAAGEMRQDCPTADVGVVFRVLQMQQNEPC